MHQAEIEFFVKQMRYFYHLGTFLLFQKNTNTMLLYNVQCLAFSFLEFSQIYFKHLDGNPATDTLLQ